MLSFCGVRAIQSCWNCRDQSCYRYPGLPGPRGESGPWSWDLTAALSSYNCERENHLGYDQSRLCSSGPSAGSWRVPSLRPQWPTGPSRFPHSLPATSSPSTPVARRPFPLAQVQDQKVKRKLVKCTQKPPPLWGPLFRQLSVHSFWIKMERD